MEYKYLDWTMPIPSESFQIHHFSLPVIPQHTYSTATDFFVK
jgi:hypothetical protein